MGSGSGVLARNEVLNAISPFFEIRTFLRVPFAPFEPFAVKLAGGSAYLRFHCCNGKTLYISYYCSLFKGVLHLGTSGFLEIKSCRHNMITKQS